MRGVGGLFAFYAEKGATVGPPWRLDADGRWWIGPNGERLRVIAGGKDIIEEPPVEVPPVEVPPAEPPTPTAEDQAAALR